MVRDWDNTVNTVWVEVFSIILNVTVILDFATLLLS